MSLDPKKSNTSDSEPSASTAALPISFIFAFFVLLYAGSLYVDARGGGFSPVVYAPYTGLQEVRALQPKSDGVDLDRGKRIYDMVCAVCHQASGMGTAGQFPPLAGSEWVTEPNPARLIRIPFGGLTGPITVKGETWNLAMPDMSGVLQDDEDVAALMSYIRQAWGNNASVVTPEQVKEVREAIAGHSGPWTAESLRAVPIE